MVAFPADKFKDDVAVTDAEIASHFEAQQGHLPHPREAEGQVRAASTCRRSGSAPPSRAQDVQRYYEDNQQQYSTPEQVRASHILLKTEGKDDAAVKKQAEDLLAKVKGGADFAALATKLSEDEVSAAKGGDLDFFGKGTMVKEFDDVAFALKPGRDRATSSSRSSATTSSSVTEKKAGLDALARRGRARRSKTSSSRSGRRRKRERISTELAGKLNKPADLDTVAKGRGLTVGESGFFARDEPIAGLGMAPGDRQRARSS